MSRFATLVHTFVFVSIFFGGCTSYHRHVNGESTFDSHGPALKVAQADLMDSQAGQIRANTELTQACAKNLPNCHLYGLYPSNLANLREQQREQTLQAVYQAQSDAAFNQALLKKNAEAEARAKKAEAEAEAARASARKLMDAAKKNGN